MLPLQETNQAAVAAERNLQAYFLSLFGRIFPPSYLASLQSPGPGYELFQAFAKIAERMSLATAHAKVAGLIATAAGAQSALALVQFTRAVSTVTVKKGTIVRASNSEKDFSLLHDVTWSVPGAALGVGVAATVASDGKTWALGSSITGTYWGIALAPTLMRLVAVGASVAATSDDGGVTWAAQTIPAGTYYGVAWNGSLFVAAGTVFATSPDGVTWTAITAPAGSFTGVVWAQALVKFLAFGSTVALSEDGVNWVGVGGAPALTSVAWSGTIFAGLGSASMYSSPDGVTWTAQTKPAGTYTAAAWGSGAAKFIIVGTNSAAYSPDGITWTATTIPAGTYDTAFWNGSAFVATGASIAAYSADGITWTAATPPTGTFQAVAPTNVPGYGLVQAVAPGYEWNIPGPRTTASGVTLPGDIDTVWSLTTDPAYGDPSITVSQVTDAAGGQDAVLDQIGADRSIARAAGETDIAFAVRIQALPDTVSPGAFQRLLAALFAPYGVTATMIEVWSTSFQTVWSAPVGSNLFVYDDPRASPPFNDRWLRDSRLGGIIVVPIIQVRDSGMAYTDTANTVASFAKRAVGAWDVPSSLLSSELQGAYDGIDYGAAAVYKSVWDSLQTIKAAGVPIDVELSGQ